MKIHLFRAIYRWCRETNRPCLKLREFKQAQAEFQEQYPFYPNLSIEAK